MKKPSAMLELIAVFELFWKMTDAVTVSTIPTHLSFACYDVVFEMGLTANDSGCPGLNQYSFKESLCH